MADDSEDGDKLTRIDVHDDSEDTQRHVLSISIDNDLNVKQSQSPHQHVINDEISNDEIKNTSRNGSLSEGCKALVSTITCKSMSSVIRMQEIVPEHSKIHNNASTKSKSKDIAGRKWSPSLDFFAASKRGTREEDRKLPRQIRKYYQKQDGLIDELRNDLDEYGTLRLENDVANTASDEKMKRSVKTMTALSFIANCFLLIGKLVAVIESGSFSIISSLVDSCVDLVSGITIYVANRAMHRTSQYQYPQGRLKLEPVAILVLSVIMSVASIQVIVQSVEVMIKADIPLDLGYMSIGIVASTILMKVGLYVLCRRYDSPSLQALSQDHRNDVLSNIVALIGAVLGQYVWPYLDPIGAILISSYIFISWCSLCYNQIKLITGYTANPHFLRRLTWLCLNHDTRIQAIDTVRAFHFGNNFIVEVDIVLPEDMTLKEAHDIGEPLQMKLERFPQVERAFVHLDYEFTHDPAEEHLFRH